MSVVEGTAGTAAVEDDAVGRVVGDPGAGSAVDVASNTGHGLMFPETDAAATGANQWLKASTKLGHEIAPTFCSIQQNRL
jgi:hypothetical protein